MTGEATSRLGLGRVSTVDALAASLRARILDSELAPGARLREQRLTDAYGVARHTVRAALRALAAEGLVRVEPHRGARVASLSADDVQGLFELRTALEVEAARLALERGGGRLPAGVHEALAAFVAACRREGGAWGEIVEAHETLHHAMVAASGSARLAAAHRAIGAESRLFLVALEPRFTRAELAADHEALVAGLELYGPDALRAHLRASAEDLLAALGRA